MVDPTKVAGNLGVVAVSGHRGFLGKHLTRVLADRDICPILIDGDVRDAAVWHRPFDVLVHLAGATHAHFERDALDAFSVNVEGTLRALQACAKWGGRIVYPSTCGVCRPEPSGRVSEEAALAPTSPYTHSKVIAESLCQRFSDYFGVSSTILRLFNIYGPHQGRPFLIPYIIERMRCGESPVLRHPNSMRDYVHVADVVEAVERILVLKEPFTVLNVGSGSAVSVVEVVEVIATALGRLPTWVVGEAAQSDPIPNVWADVTKVQALLCWSPEIDLVSGLREVALGRSGRDKTT